MRSTPTPIGSRLAAAVLRRAPPWSVLAATRAMGRAARVPLPTPVARAAAGAYTRWFDVNLSEAEGDVVEGRFRSFDDFFTRRLRPDAREVGRHPHALCSPCDGRVRDFGPILRTRDGRGTHVEAKGFRYGVAELLADGELARAFEGGWHTTIYLHPRDYHRVHTPAPAFVSSITAVPGRLMPVNDASLDQAPRLLPQNERLVHVLRVGEGLLAVVMVAAFGVGHMSCSYTQAPAHPRRVERRSFGEGAVRLSAGDELGIFHLGSTVVLLGSGDLLDGPLRLERGGRVLAGQLLAPLHPNVRQRLPHHGDLD